MKSKKKICFIVPVHWSAYFGGIEYQVKLLVDKLRNNNNLKIFYLARDIKENYKTDNYSIIQIRKPIGIYKYAFFLDTIKLLNILFKIKPDIIYQNGGCAYTGIAALYAKMTNCKSIFHIGSDNDIIPQEKIKYVKQINRFIDRKFIDYGIKNTPFIIAQSEFQKKILVEKKIKGNATIIKNFHPIPKKVKSTQKEDLILWVANFKPLKQPEIFIDLCISLQKKGINSKFIMIGKETKYPKNFQNLLEEKIDKVKGLFYLGKRSIEEVNYYLEKAKIFVNTSLWEGFPNTFIQAWMRKAVVVSLNCDPDNLLSLKKLGIRSGCKRKMEEDIIELLKNENLRLQYAERAFHYSRKNFTEDNLNYLVEYILK